MQIRGRKNWAVLDISSKREEMRVKLRDFRVGAWVIGLALSILSATGSILLGHTSGSLPPAAGQTIIINISQTTEAPGTQAERKETPLSPSEQ